MLSLTPKPNSYASALPSLKESQTAASPSKIPKLRHTQSHASLSTPSPVKPSKHFYPFTSGLRTPASTAVHKNIYLTKDSLTPVPSLTAWDTVGRLADMKGMWLEMQRQVASAAEVKDGLDERLAEHKARGIRI